MEQEILATGIKAAKISKELPTTELPKTAEPPKELPKATKLPKELPKTAEMLKEMTFCTFKFDALEGGDLKHSDLEHYGVPMEVQKLLQDYRSSQDIIATLGLAEPSEEDKMKVAEMITNNPDKLLPAVEATAITTAIARKPCLYREDGCDWQFCEHDHISITTDETEAEYYNTCECTCLDWHTCDDVKNTELEEPAEYEVEGEVAPTTKVTNTTKLEEPVNHEVENKTIRIPVLSEHIME